MKDEILEKIITLDGKDKYYICDMTEQSGKIYYFATKVDENNQPLGQSTFFEKVLVDGKYFLEDVTDTKTYQYLSAIFITKISENPDLYLNKEEAA